MTKVEEVREKTQKDLVEKLNKYGKCALIRCTGFGKTWMLSKIFEEYDNVLYLYPTEVIKQTVKNASTQLGFGSLNNVTFMTYQKLVISFSLSNLGYFDDFDLIVFDEAHRIGAENAQKFIRQIMIRNEGKCHFIGATATPYREDDFDFVSEFFNKITVFPYTLHDAFQDGIIKKPYYCYCSFDVATDIKNSLTEHKVKMEESELTSKTLEIANMYGVENTIKTVCDECCDDTSYLKFIVFFSTTEQLRSKRLDVVRWFKKAYPTHSVRTLTVISDTKEERNNVKKLNKLTYREKTIDLIACIDMLNMGYHVSNLTGIVMYRCTNSSVVYVQQLGRALSTDMNDSCIVFDVVDNLHRKSLFNLSVSSYDSDNKPQDTGDSKNKTNWYKNCNDIKSEDLIARGNIAKYRELIDKVVCEPVQHDCREAFGLFFKRWLRVQGKKFPFTEKEFMNTYNKSNEEFCRYIKQKCREIGVDYIFDDKDKILSVGKKGDGLPLSVFADFRGVSVDSILLMLGIGLD